MKSVEYLMLSVERVPGVQCAVRGRAVSVQRSALSIFSRKKEALQSNANQKLFTIHYSLFTEKCRRLFS